MTELGYIEGQNITYDVQSTGIDIAVYQSILQQFVADDVDLIFVFPTEASQEAKAATQGTDIPVVFDFAFIEDTNLVNSLREPGGNITGVRFPGPEIAGKRLEIVLELVPDAKQIWIPYLKDYPSVPPQMEALGPIAEAAGVTLIEFPASNPAELQAELDARVASGDIGIDAILLLAEPIAAIPDFFSIIVKFAYDHQVPIGGTPSPVEGYEVIFGLLPNVFSAGEQAAVLADKVLKGTAAGTIPVVSPESYLQINVKVAQELGVTVPEGLLAQADEVIR
jgi:putative ABC transport system substrate-binding protein